MDLIPKKNFGGIKNPMSAVKGANFPLDKVLKIGVILASFLIVISLASWAGFKIYEGFADKKIQALQAEQAAIFSANDKLEAENILSVEENANVLQSLLGSHVYVSAFFDWISKYTLPRVRWTACSLDSQKGLATLKGQAGDYSTLAKQLLAFGAAETGFQNLKISGVSLDKTGSVNFDLSFEIDSKKLQK